MPFEKEIDVRDVQKFECIIRVDKKKDETNLRSEKELKELKEKITHLDQNMKN